MKGKSMKKPRQKRPEPTKLKNHIITRLYALQGVLFFWVKAILFIYTTIIQNLFKVGLKLGKREVLWGKKIMIPVGLNTIFFKPNWV